MGAEDGEGGAAVSGAGSGEGGREGAGGEDGAGGSEDATGGDGAEDVDAAVGGDGVVGAGLEEVEGVGLAAMAFARAIEVWRRRTRFRSPFSLLVLASNLSSVDC